ncbi:zinc finger protein 516-like [Stigmatopora argus]
METKVSREGDGEMEEDPASGHTCGVCGRTFPLLSSLSQHMRRHTREKPYKCPYCDHRTAQKGTLKAHVRSHKLGLLSLDERPKEGETPDVPETVQKKAAKKKAKDPEADAGPLESQVRRLRNVQDHGCRICGRRFRQAWFLQSHMRIHRAKAQLRGGEGERPPPTVNGVPQDPAALANDECLYELCGNCGHFFDDCENLRAHERFHKPGPKAAPDSRASPPTQERFLEGLRLTRTTPKEARTELGRRIPELDPLCSYQAWQLATRGRLAEAGEKCLGWEERLADADVAFDTAKGEYVPVKPEKKRKPVDVPAATGAKKKKGDGGDKKSCLKDRILLNGLGRAFYEALQHRSGQDARSGSGNNSTNNNSSSSSSNQDQKDEKPLLCQHCDFHTSDPSLLSSHMQARHRDVKPTVASDKASGQNDSAASRYVDYLRKRSAQLCQPYWNPFPGLPGELNVKMEKCAEASDLGSLLNLSTPADNKRRDSVQKEGPPRHRCPYCSHATRYPEVLWIHQRVLHRVGSGSSAAPKWAPCSNGARGPKTSRWRRTGAPPFLEGKDCPALPAPRSQRTQPPAATDANRTPARSQSSAKSKDAKAPDSRGRVKSEQKRTSESGGGGKASSSAKSVSVRTAEEGHFPKEGLGFMLSHGAASSDSIPRHPQRLPSPSPKGADLWATMSMWGHRAYLDPLLYSQAKSNVAADPPADFDVVSLLKGYNPHELAALYQHWGFVDPRLDPQAMLRLNGHFGNEVHSSTEASRQVTSRSTSTLGSLHKGT